MTDRLPQEEYFPVYPGLALQDDRYIIRRKLGQGVYSETYLVEGTAKESNARYHAAKILSLEATSYHASGKMQEFEFLKAIQDCEDYDSLPILWDDFFIDGPRGRHLCLIMDLLSTDVSSFRRQFPNAALPSFWVKNITSLVIEGLVQLHDLGIIHTDIKPTNMLFRGGIPDAFLERCLATEDVIVEDVINIDGTSWPILACQPIPHLFTPETTGHDAELIAIVLNDLGHGQWAGRQPTVDEFSAPALRAPELILGSSFGPKIDIWAIGCVTFELLVGRWLFHPQEGEGGGRPEDDHLARMMELTGESFGPATLQHAWLRDEYFDENGQLLRVRREELHPSSIEDALGEYNILPQDEIRPAAEFVRACIHLDPMSRPSAESLQFHPWLDDAMRC